MNDKIPPETDQELDASEMEELLQDLDETENLETETISNDADDFVDDSESTIIEKLKSALDEEKKRALIAVADLENYRKRASKNAQEQIKYASLPLMTELLEAVDNLNRATESADKDSANSGLLEGVKMVADQIINILKTNHCEPIVSVGQPFDPNLHQAVQMQPSDEFPANTVMMELRTGYRLHDRVVRPSQVFVSTGSSKDQ